MPEEKKLDPQVLKERVGKHLRAADEFTRYQRYEEAMREIEIALKLDPKNNYARSFLERVKLMNKRVQEKEAEQTSSLEMSLEERMAIIAKHLSTAEEYINRKDYRHALEEVAQVYKIDPMNYYAQAYSERIDLLMQEESAAGAKLFKAALKPALSDIEKQQSQSVERGSILMYRELLKEVWLDGKVTEQEAHELSAMRELFNISGQEHDQLEREVKIEAYLEALRIAWRDNTLSNTEREVLQIMRDKYDITVEDQTIAETRFEEIKHSSKSRGTILLVDSDRENLVSLSKLFKQRGFTIFIAQKVEDALQILINQTPSLIISEVLFPNSSIDGVGFFKKLREHPVLKRTPFFFLSSITDKKIMQAGFHLGVDHFLVKPVDIDLLFAIIEGKLRISL